MSDNINNYNDNSFNLSQAYSYTLLLQVDTAFFSYAVIYQARLLVSAQNCDLSELSEPKQLSELLSATYQKVIIGLPASGFTLVPVSLFDENQVAGFARLLDVNENEKVFAQALDEDNVIIYKTSPALVSAIEKFGLKNVVYAANGWIKAISKDNPAGDSIYVNVDKDIAHFLYFSNGKLRFYNTFEFKNEDELAYFATFVSEELNLKPQDTTLILSGDVNTDDKNITRLADFYIKVELSNLQVLELPGQIPAHKILALAALSLCGSSEAH